MNTNILYTNQERILYKRKFEEAELIRDLKLDILLDAMSDQNIYLKSLCKKILLHSSCNLDEIHMRQEIVKEAIKSQDFFINVYHISSDCLAKTDSYREMTHPRYDKIVPVVKKIIMHREIAEIHISYLEKLNQLLFNMTTHSVQSNKLLEFCEEVVAIYSEVFIHEVKHLLSNLACLKSNTKIEISGHLGVGFKLTDIHLHSIKKHEESLLNNMKKDIISDAVILLDNNILINNSEEIIAGSLLYLYKTVSEFNNEMKSLFEKVREMFGFYVGSINLFNCFKQKSKCICFPSFNNPSELQFHELYDVTLMINSNTEVIGNSISLSDKKLCIITGTNQGGKTTFLRSLGLAQIMAQCGLFVTAEYFSSKLFQGVFTYFPNEEDKTLNKGLLEQELCRLNELVVHMSTNSLLLMNETFSTTIEYDASLLAEQITSAFYKCGVTTVFVTHLFEYAHKLYINNSEDYLFYLAQRQQGGNRTYRLEEGEPLRSSFALDLYHQIIE